MTPSHEPPPADELAHLKSIPWCAKLLSDPDLILERPTGRIPKPDSCDALMSRIWQTPSTLRAFILFYRRPQPQPLTEPPRDLSVHALVTLGSDLDGWAGMLHGGAVSALLDETMIMVPQIDANVATRSSADGALIMTAYLNIKFARPILTPGTVLVTARMAKSEGRKRFVEGVITDGEGTVLASAEALFVMAKKQKL